MKTIKLGNEVRDISSGFAGIAISRTEYLVGCVQYGVRGKIGPDGRMAESWNIDEPLLEIVGDGVAVVPRETGGPSSRISGCPA